MTGSDLIVAAPWIIFGICLLVILLRLIRARRSAQRSPPADQPRDDQSS